MTDHLLIGEDLSDNGSCERIDRERTEETHIDGDEMDLGVTVLAGLGGRHFGDLARATYSNCQCNFKATTMNTHP